MLIILHFAVQYSDMLIIVGLGNPGEEYRSTRHNVGSLILERLETRYAFQGKRELGSWSSVVSTGSICSHEVTFAIPTTFMNHSGNAVAHMVREGYTLDSIVVVYDDIALPFGDIRVSFDRGDGGHNGLKSIIAATGSKKFIRIRIGIAERGFFGGIKRPKEGMLADFVLRSFRTKELAKIDDVAKKVGSALELILTKGKEAAMQEINEKVSE
jgi:peptidyl-tRNA hydrolase, PTH1 family